MEPIQDFAGLICRLRSLKERKRVVVVCPNDPHTEYVITRSLHEGFADFLLVADTPHLLNSEYIRLQYPDHVKVYEATSPDKAAQEAVSLIREGHADVLMKGIINTDNLLRAVLNKERAEPYHGGTDPDVQEIAVLLGCGGHSPSYLGTIRGDAAV